MVHMVHMVISDQFCRRSVVGVFWSLQEVLIDILDEVISFW